MGDDKGGPVTAGDHIGQRERLAAARDPEQDLRVLTRRDPGRQDIGRFFLVWDKFERRLQLE